MTDDTHGTPQDEHEAGYEQEHLEHQEPAAGGEEVWHGTVDDDFSDDPAAVEMTHASEEGDASHEESSLAEKPRRRGGGMLSAIVIIGGILLLGVLIYWQFGSNLHGGEQPAPASTAVIKPTPGGPQYAIYPGPTESSKIVTMAPSSTPVTISVSAQPSAPAPAQPSAPAVSAVATTPAPTPPTVSQAPVSAVAPASTVAPAQPSDSRVAALSAKVDELQKSLDQATQQLSTMSGKLAASQSTQPNLDIENRLNGIEQKLMQIDHPAVAAAPVAKKKPKAKLSSVTVMPMDEESGLSEAPAPVKKTVAHTTKHKTAAHKTSKPAKPSVHWVLRAASPNEAWIGSDAGTSDLQPVHVGDEVPGIGIVTAIREEGGAWVVDGTTGTIH